MWHDPWPCRFAFGSASREDLLTVIGLLQRQVAVAEARAEVAEFQAAELAAANERLTARVAELERRLSRNSSNSSLPPSTGTFSRPEKKKASESGCKWGRQPGSGGLGLSMVAGPGVLEENLPASCTGCGSGLGPGDSIGFERRQVRDIALCSVTVTEHRAHRCRCACGTVTAEPMPVEVAGPPSSYGPNVRALAVYLLVFQHIPVERTAILLKDVTGVEVSTGWVASLLPEAAGLVADSLHLIRAVVIGGTTQPVGSEGPLLRRCESRTGRDPDECRFGSFHPPGGSGRRTGPPYSGQGPSPAADALPLCQARTRTPVSRPVWPCPPRGRSSAGKGRCVCKPRRPRCGRYDRRRGGNLGTGNVRRATAHASR
ncbi:DUF6444 domain-containing protein [Streptomyces sp. NPDC055085]